MYTLGAVEPNLLLRPFIHNFFKNKLESPSLSGYSGIKNPLFGNSKLHLSTIFLLSSFITNLLSNSSSISIYNLESLIAIKYFK